MVNRCSRRERIAVRGEEVCSRGRDCNTSPKQLKQSYRKKTRYNALKD